ncbi:MAG TPA: prolipoprotein diacylglyceryl transferase [Myxococcota bacterium]|nr:prolipoprotein diacylglyceryl transferase [Myxococcota bacterium]
MYPILWEPFGFPISSFGVMMALGFLAATWITARHMEEEGLDPDLSTSMLLWCMLGGVAGAKLYYAVDVNLRTGAPIAELIFSRDGITWYGGLIGGTLAAIVGCRRSGIPVRLYSQCVCTGAAVGQAIGRVGCFLVGDDYGRPTDGPLGIAFPRGAPPTLDPVHPTQIYEAVWLVAVAGWLWSRRRRSPFLFGEYLALNGLGRFFIEILRVNPRVALGLTEPQWIALGLIVFGVGGLVYFRGRPLPAPTPEAAADAAAGNAGARLRERPAREER